MTKDIISQFKHQPKLRIVQFAKSKNQVDLSNKAKRAEKLQKSECFEIVDSTDHIFKFEWPSAS